MTRGGAILVIDVPDASSTPALAESFYVTLNATV
jgi:hypothetical protein